jgi:hypothetical protein
MRRHLNYLKYVLRHKWYVLLAIRKLRGSLIRAILHDLSKFRPSEWIPYSYTFYTDTGESQYIEHFKFKEAWLCHQKRNDHHWQYWVLNQDDGDAIPIEMPIKVIKEMVADWVGAGMAIGGNNDIVSWYICNKHRMILHPHTRAYAEYFVNTARIF